MPLPVSTRLRFLASCCGAIAVAAGSGCGHLRYEAKPLVPEQSAQAFDQRSLADPGLRQFLRQNLGRDFAGSEAYRWDFEALAWVAFYYNPALEVARAQWRSAQAAARTAGEKPNPTLGLTPGYSTNPGAGVSPWFPAVTLDFPLETAGKRGHRADAAQGTSEAARQDIFSAVWKVRSDLRRALLDLAAATHRGERLRAQARLQQHIVDLLEQRLAAGAIAAPEVATGRLAALRAEAAAADAIRQEAIGRQRVAIVLGVPAAALDGRVLRPPEPPARLSPAALAAARAEALRARPDIMAALARYRSAEAALALEVARQFPDIHLGPGYQWDQGQNKWTIGFTMELPLFHQNQGPIHEAEAHRAEAAAQFLATQAQAIAEIDTAATAQNAALAQLDTLQRTQAQLRRQQEQAERRLRAGAANELETAGTALEFETGELALNEAENQAALAAGQLEDALQIPFIRAAALEQSPRVSAVLPSR